MPVNVDDPFDAIKLPMGLFQNCVQPGGKGTVVDIPRDRIGDHRMGHHSFRMDMAVAMAMAMHDTVPSQKQEKK